MRLSQFIREHTEDVLRDWAEFAHTLTPAGEALDEEGLRDFAQAMLEVIALDLETPQSSEQQFQKSRGTQASVRHTAAEAHGAARAERGFTLQQMVAEFRALRASVMRLWFEHEENIDRSHLDDLTRFNEAVDQALAESISRYKQDLDRSKDTFLGILGHDLRNPLSAIMVSASRTLFKGTTDPSTAHRILSSGERMRQIIDDLLDFKRCRLGTGIPISPVEMDLTELCQDTIDEVAGAHPSSEMRFESEHALLGVWDPARIGQVLSNLISNAVQHGATDRPITIAAHATDDHAVVTVHNFGPVIEPTALESIFSPMTRGDRRKKTEGLGLGLYVASEIVRAHDGRIRVESTEERGTTFTVDLPRRPATQHPTPGSHHVSPSVAAY